MSKVTRVSLTLLCIFMILLIVIVPSMLRDESVKCITSSEFTSDSVVISDTVTATVYHAVASQCDGDFLTTASGRKISSTYTAYDHRYIAVSRDLLDTYNYGDTVVIEGIGDYDGIYIVADTMNERFTKYIDILINPGMKVGKWTDVIIKKVIK